MKGDEEKGEKENSQKGKWKDGERKVKRVGVGTQGGEGQGEKMEKRKGK